MEESCNLQKKIEEAIKSKAGEMAKAIAKNKNIEIRHSKEENGIVVFESQLKKIK